jgi:hypothetical protein
MLKKWKTSVLRAFRIGYLPIIQAQGQLLIYGEYPKNRKITYMIWISVTYRNFKSGVKSPARKMRL